MVPGAPRHHLALRVAIYEGRATRLTRPEYPSNILVQISERADQNVPELEQILAGGFKLVCVNDMANASAVDGAAMDLVAGQIHSFFEAFIGR